MIFGNQNDRTPTFLFNVDLCTRHFAVFGEEHNLRSAIGAKFGNIYGADSLGEFDVQGF